jgi:hypothetical protein
MRKSSHDVIAAEAYHEAGHAVMCHMLRIRVRSISIEGDELYGGETEYANPLKAGKADPNDIRARLRLEKAVMLCMAGPLAQKKSVPKAQVSDYGGVLDFEDASTLAIRFFRSRKIAMAYLNFVREWVSQKWEEPRVWAIVERLASALIKKRKLSGVQANAIIQGRHVD